MSYGRAAGSAGRFSIIHSGRLLCRLAIPFPCYPTPIQPISTDPPTINHHLYIEEAFRPSAGYPMGAEPDRLDAFPSCWKIVVSPCHAISILFNIYPSDFDRSTDNKPSMGFIRSFSTISWISYGRET